MDLRRHEYKNKINLQIRDLQKCVEFDENMLDNLKDQGDTIYVRAQIDKVTIKNDKRNQEIEKLIHKLHDVETGKLDEEIKKNIIDTRQKQEENKIIVAQKRIENIERKKIASEISQNYYKRALKSDREQRYLKKDIQRSYSYYLRVCDSIPDYIIRNLKEMPNNKGYIWRGVRCFGELPNEYNRPLTLFEKQRGGLLIIHEWTQTEYKVYHKHGKDRKTLHSIEKRRHIPFNL